MPERTLQRRLEREWRELAARLAVGTPGRPSWLVAGRPVLPIRPLALFAQLEEVLLAWRELRERPLGGWAGRYVTSAWTLKDLLAHLASWAEEFRRDVETVARGESFDRSIPYALSVMGPGEWNAVEVEARRALSLEEVLDQFEAETHRLQHLVLALPEQTLFRPAAFPYAPSGDPAERWKGNIAVVVMSKCAHDQYHLGRIRHWMDGLEGGRR